MTEQGSLDPTARIEALRARGAERLDPVGFRFVEALAGRMAAQPDAVRQRLVDRLARILATYDARLERAERAAEDALARGSADFPDAVNVLREYRDAGDFTGLRRQLARLNARRGDRALSELLADIERRAAPTGETAPPLLPIARVNTLKSAAVFQRTWSRLRLDQQLAQALEQAPENAGPLNSHSLVLRALRLMRDISPDYLERLFEYVETLLWLEQLGGGPAQKTTGRGERGGKRKAGRGGG